MQMRIHKGDVFKYKHAGMYNVLYTHLNIRFLFLEMKSMDMKVTIKLGHLLGLKIYFSVYVGTFLLNTTETALFPQLSDKEYFFWP